MAIEFHCDHCGRLVRTSGEHAGKRGKCPYCKQSVYIPTPSDQIEPLELAPLDKKHEVEKKRLEDEARAITQEIRSDKTEIPHEPVKSNLPIPEDDIRLRPTTHELVVEYVLAMAQGKLNEAEQYAADIRANMDAAEEVIQQLTMDDLPPPELADIPHPVLVGFLRQLRASG